MKVFELEVFINQYNELKQQVQKQGWYNTSLSIKCAIISRILFLYGKKLPLFVDILSVASDLSGQAIMNGSITSCLLTQRPIEDTFGSFVPITTTAERKTIDRPIDMNDVESVSNFIRKCLEVSCKINMVDSSILQNEIDSIISNFIDVIGLKSQVSKVFKICDAYESGVGHGIKQEVVTNPYNDPDLKEAFEIGLKKGNDIKREHGLEDS